MQFCTYVTKIHQEKRPYFQVFPLKTPYLFVASLDNDFMLIVTLSMNI